MLSEQMQHVKAAVAMGVTGVSIPAAWLPAAWATELDYGLKILLTIIGILTGIYSMLYYRKRYKEK